MGVSGGVWECGKPERFSIISIPQSEGEGGGDFLFKAPTGPLFRLPLPPLLARRRFSAAADFLFAAFSFGGGFVRRPKKGPKPENSRTVNQWGLRGRIPVNPLRPSYIWDDYYGVPQSIYYLEDNTREMTEEEKAEFLADRKAFSQRYVKLVADELERLKKEVREEDDG